MKLKARTHAYNLVINGSSHHKVQSNFWLNSHLDIDLFFDIAFVSLRFNFYVMLPWPMSVAGPRKRCSISFIVAPWSGVRTLRRCFLSWRTSAGWWIRGRLVKSAYWAKSKRSLRLGFWFWRTCTVPGKPSRASWRTWRRATTRPILSRLVGRRKCAFTVETCRMALLCVLHPNSPKYLRSSLGRKIWTKLAVQCPCSGSFDWLIDWLIDRLFDWLIDWMGRIILFWTWLPSIYGCTELKKLLTFYYILTIIFPLHSMFVDDYTWEFLFYFFYRTRYLGSLISFRTTWAAFLPLSHERQQTISNFRHKWVSAVTYSGGFLLFVTAKGVYLVFTSYL